MDTLEIIDTFDGLYEKRQRESRQISDNNRRLEAVGGRVKSALRERDCLRSQNKDLQNEKSQLRCQVDALKNRNSDLQGDVCRLRQKTDCLLRERDSLRCENDRINAKLVRLERDASNARDLLEKMKTDYKCRLNAAEDRIEDLTGRLKNAECEISGLRRQTRDYECQIRDLKAIRAENEARIANLEDENADQRRTIRELNEKLDVRQVAIDTLAEELKDKNCSLSRARAKNDELERQAAADRDEICYLSRKCKNLTCENSNLKEDVNLLNVKLKNYAAEYGALECQLKQYSNQLADIEDAGFGGTVAPRSTRGGSASGSRKSYKTGGTRYSASRKSTGGSRRSVSSRSRNPVSRKSRSVASSRRTGNTKQWRLKGLESRLKGLEGDINSLRNKI